jgi:hypothetical protein
MCPYRVIHSEKGRKYIIINRTIIYRLKRNLATACILQYRSSACLSSSCHFLQPGTSPEMLDAICEIMEVRVGLSSVTQLPSHIDIYTRC